MSKSLTAAEANVIQASWMALDSNAPEAEKKKVFKAMESLPKNYYSISREGLAVAMVSGQPLNMPIPLERCKEYWGHLVKTNLAWQFDKWIDL